MADVPITRVELAQIASRQRTRNVLAVISAFVSLVSVVALIAFAIYYIDQAGSTKTSLERQNCIAQLNGTFFGHLAGALAQQPTTLDRQDFLDLMKADAQQLKNLDATCPADP